MLPKNPKKSADAGLKSAYDLAMNRLGRREPGEPRLTAGQVARIAEIDRDYTARIAEREVMLTSRLAAAGGDPERLAALRDEHQRELARLREKMEGEKDRVRGERAGG